MRRRIVRLAGRLGWRLARRHARRALPWVVVPASLGAGAVAIPVAAGAVAVARRRRHRRPDPCGPDGLALPDGRGDVVVTTDGAELAVHVAGADEGPVVVLVHCWTGAKELWAPVARRLVHLGHRVVLYDQRGHGSSTWGDGLPDVDRLGDDLAAILAHVDASAAVVAGHSMGGMSIQAYVGRHPGDAAGRLSGAVLVATAARTFGRELPAALAERVLGDVAPAWTRTGRIGTSLARRSLGAGAHPAHAVAVRDLLHATPGPVRVECLLAMARMDLGPDLAGTSVPATVLVGTRDLLTPPRSAKALARAWPSAELKVLPGAGHMLPIERPDEVVEAVLAGASRW